MSALSLTVKDGFFLTLYYIWGYKAPFEMAEVFLMTERQVAEMTAAFREIPTIAMMKPKAPGI